MNTKIKVSFFDRLDHPIPIKEVLLEEIILGIKNGEWKEKVITCWDDIANKKTLPCFTPSGLYSYRKKDGLEVFSGIICLDFDSLENVSLFKRQCSRIPWIWCAFTTPSKRGVKVLVLTEAQKEDYAIYEASIAKKIVDSTGCLRDERAKDLARLQFVSYDPKLFLNTSPSYFKIGDSKL
jgi:hypothetical protein